VAYERRNAANGHHRKQRIVAGTVSTPVAIIAGAIIHRLWGDELGQEVTIAIASVVGSMITATTICFWDLRGIALSWIFKGRRQRK